MASSKTAADTREPSKLSSGGDAIGGARDKSSESITTNAKPSRDSSPVRKDPVSAASSNGGTATASYRNKKKPSTLKSSKTSRETSPVRSVSSVALRTPQTQTLPDLLHQPLTHRPLPNSPRLKSPPSASSQSPILLPQKKSEPAPLAAVPPSIVLLREGHRGPEDPEELVLPSGMRTPRSNSSPALETVVESSLPSTPAIGATKSLSDQVAALVARQPNKIPEETEGVKQSTGKAAPPPPQEARTGSITSVATRSQAESESESGYKSEEKPPATSSSTNKAPAPQKPFTRRPTVMGTDNSSRNMTVETEIVVSVPQVAVGVVGNPGGASIRSKKSTDTIRAPKKEKRKMAKRPGASGNTNPSSKADIFAAKIAEAVDEANSSDSEETFVYESNPPEAATAQRPTSRFHSRTPSATSIHGGPDPRGQRLPLLALDGSQTTGRKGMKFANTSMNNSSVMGNEGPSGDGAGTERGGAGGSGTTVGLTGSSRGDAQAQRDQNGTVRHPNNGHRSILTDDSPFYQVSSHKPSTHSLRNVAASHISSRHGSRTTSPRHATPLRNGVNEYGSKKSNRIFVSSYEGDGEGGDERVPLIAANRGNRPHRHSRRPGSGSLRQLERAQRQRGWFRNYAGCIIAIITIILVMTGVAGFLFATTKALQEVKVLEVTDVLVSKQEIMLDLVVQAINPNAIAVTVGSMDVNLFAKSSHIRDGKGKDDDDEGHGGDEDDEYEEDDSSWWTTRKRGRRRRGRGRKSTSSQATRPPASGEGADEEYLGRVRVGTRNTNEELLSSHLASHHQFRIEDNVDEGTDPPDVPEQDRQTMLLGRIFSFDSALTFDGSPIRRKLTNSTGELRLGRPGNKTEEGGTERWERVLQHPFELIVRGVLRYQLPLSGRVRTASIGGSVMVHPDNDVGGGGGGGGGTGGGTGGGSDV